MNIEQTTQSMKVRKVLIVIVAVALGEGWTMSDSETRQGQCDYLIIVCRLSVGGLLTF